MFDKIGVELARRGGGGVSSIARANTLSAGAGWLSVTEFADAESTIAALHEAGGPDAPRRAARRTASGR